MNSNNISNCNAEALTFAWEVFRTKAAYCRQWMQPNTHCASFWPVMVAAHPIRLGSDFVAVAQLNSGALNALGWTSCDWRKEDMWIIDKKMALFDEFHSNGWKLSEKSRNLLEIRKFKIFGRKILVWKNSNFVKEKKLKKNPLGKIAGMIDIVILRRMAVASHRSWSNFNRQRRWNVVVFAKSGRIIVQRFTNTVIQLIGGECSVLVGFACSSGCDSCGRCIITISV